VVMEDSVAERDIQYDEICKRWKEGTASCVYGPSLHSVSTEMRPATLRCRHDCMTEHELVSKRTGQSGQWPEPNDVISHQEQETGPISPVTDCLALGGVHELGVNWSESDGEASTVTMQTNHRSDTDLAHPLPRSATQATAQTYDC